MGFVPTALGQEEAADDAAAAVEEAVEEAAPVSVEMFTVNNTWMMVSTFLVFIMHLGFASVESGLTRAKNTVNILFKNTAIVAIGLLTYALCGFNLMYPGDFNGWFGFAGFGINPGADYSPIAYAGGNYSYWTDFLFQGMFAATAATIVSGAVAERIKLHSFLIFSALYVAVAYPIAGSWQWGGGWLSAKGFHDFAGSTLVHSVGGWAALAGVLVLGPRLGKYVNGSVRAIPGHNMPLVTIGVFLLWLGWFGFNGGSVLSADAEGTSYVLVTTSLAAAAGILASMLTSWIVQKKPDLSMALNGCLAGLVGITAGADVVSISASIIIGLIAGIIVVFSVIAFDKIKIDDPVGAISVHLVCGVWGTLATGIWGTDCNFMVQLTGVIAYGIFCFIIAFALFFLLKITLGIRVPEEEELRGLDIGEHGMEAYSGFQIFSNQ
ncbi:MAG: ammonium transporter [Verrucomicrobia bacterium]|nr:ammonium transporter [Kiritimatiellia bacterium]MCP5487856.1 ammonium transporter [Verrucomicrobiota bacterium]